MTTVSPSSTRIVRWSPFAIRASAESGSPWLPGAQDHELLGRQALDLVRVDEVVLGDLEQAEVSRDRGVAQHRASGDGDLAVGLDGRVAHLLDAMDVARERRDEDLAFGVGDQVSEDLAHLGLGTGHASALRVRGVGQHQVDALLREPGDRRVVGEHPVDRRLVELEVAGVQDVALRRAHEDAHRVRDGVIHGEEVERERPQRRVATRLDLAQLDVLDPRLVELALDEAEGETAAEDRDSPVEVAQQVGQRADVVLVAVRDHDPAHLVHVLEDVGVVGQDQVDPGMVFVGEHEAGVDDDEVLAVLDDRHVLADLVKPAERDDADRRGPRAVLWLVVLAFSWFLGHA